MAPSMRRNVARVPEKVRIVVYLGTLRRNKTPRQEGQEEQQLI